jgi:hypothetical protein
MTVKTLLASLDADEITEWQAFFMIRDELMAQKEKKEELTDQIKSGLSAFKSWE